MFPAMFFSDGIVADMMGLLVQYFFIKLLFWVRDDIFLKDVISVGNSISGYLLIAGSFTRRGFAVKCFIICRFFWRKPWLDRSIFTAAEAYNPAQIAAILLLCVVLLYLYLNSKLSTKNIVPTLLPPIIIISAESILGFVWVIGISNFL